LTVFLVARVELALMLLIVLFAECDLTLALLLPLLNCGRAGIPSLLLLCGLLHYAVVHFRLQLVLNLSCLSYNLFLLLG